MVVGSRAHMIAPHQGQSCLLLAVSASSLIQPEGIIQGGPGLGCCRAYQWIYVYSAQHYHLRGLQPYAPALQTPRVLALLHLGTQGLLLLLKSSSCKRYQLKLRMSFRHPPSHHHHMSNIRLSLLSLTTDHPNFVCIACPSLYWMSFAKNLIICLQRGGFHYLPYHAATRFSLHKKSMVC